MNKKWYLVKTKMMVHFSLANFHLIVLWFCAARMSFDRKRTDFTEKKHKNHKLKSAYVICIENIEHSLKRCLQSDSEIENWMLRAVRQITLSSDYAYAVHIEMHTSLDVLNNLWMNIVHIYTDKTISTVLDE